MENGWTFGHIGIAVRDIDKAIKYYQSLGAVLTDAPVVHPVGDPKEWKIYGKTPTKLKIKACRVQIGSLTLEMHQPIEGESLWKEFLETKGEGINHLGFFVDDVDREEAKLVEKGFAVLYSSRFQNGGGATYFDTGKVGNLIIELLQRRE